MNRFSLVIGFVVLGCASATTEPPKDQSDTVTIPLDQIWANYMPGTRDILTLEPEVFSSEASRLPHDVQAQRARESMINQIGSKLQSGPVEKDGPSIMPKPRPAFAVLGTGREALQAAAGVFAQSHKPRPSFPEGSEISIVFFRIQPVVESNWSKSSAKAKRLGFTTAFMATA